MMNLLVLTLYLLARIASYVSYLINRLFHVEIIVLEKIRDSLTNFAFSYQIEILLFLRVE